MPNLSDKSLRRLTALNQWLGDVYGPQSQLITLLADAGLNDAQIEQIKQQHLEQFLQAVLDVLDSYTDLPNPEFNVLMVQYYGLADGKLQAIKSIADSLGVSTTRVRKLVEKRLDFYRDPNRQAQLRDDLAIIARWLLDSAATH